MAVRGSAPSVLKVLVVGDNNVNKGLLLAKFENSQQQNFPFVSTIGLPFRVREVRVEGRLVRLQLWDAGWAEAWAALTAPPQDPLAAAALLLVYDVTREDTYESVRTWLQRMRSEARGQERLIMVLADNCHYLHDDRQVTWERGKQLGLEADRPFFEVSAVTGTNVEAVLKAITSSMLAKDSAAAPSTSAGSTKASCCVQ
ncbi:ras-related protein Rab-8B-like [Eriocheir sinensis]|uniref:ras-related protein Rab-8B-like n=1 Tax=Eriocheir sinensis TaxID=95602 RepID=UPI0021C701B9|nr:ras-related protein Rab-8B-like [Eriocheir sinensis]